MPPAGVPCATADAALAITAPAAGAGVGARAQLLVLAQARNSMCYCLTSTRKNWACEASARRAASTYSSRPVTCCLLGTVAWLCKLPVHDRACPMFRKAAIALQPPLCHESFGASQTFVLLLFIPD